MEEAVDELCEAILTFRSFVFTFPLNWGAHCLSPKQKLFVNCQHSLFFLTTGTNRAFSDASDVVCFFYFSAAAKLISTFVVQTQQVHQLFIITDPPGHFESHSNLHKNKAGFPTNKQNM